MKIILALISMIPCTMGVTWTPDNSCPLSPHEWNSPIKAQFFLRTRKTKEINYIPSPIPENFLSLTGFDPRVTTFVLIHGFLRNFHTTWVQDTMTILMNTTKANVILVDWSDAYVAQVSRSLAIPKFDILNYKRAVVSTPNVAVQIAMILESIARLSVVPMNRWYKIHFVGHSLGAHIAGQAARNIQSTKVHRVTGLDPAGPCFEGVNTVLKLRKTDAQFVDVIHTNCDPKRRNNFGIAEAIGESSVPKSIP
ncbi:hypothetical protein QAD02_011282 [Eretmocerus hayati]|uniref:Uncharacterized protein n=1 Tax=Eretmocerus hayati TaxID=131215 RepID=A0ACC2NXH1_9HYME|nr:hypothetical protein QAD02_011282 [Eretmocerus hayati]